MTGAIADLLRALDPMQKKNRPARMTDAMRGKCLSSPGPVLAASSHVTEGSCRWVAQ